MKDEDIIGKSFIAFTFPYDGTLKCDNDYNRLIGKRVVAKNFHVMYSQYVNAGVDGEDIHLHLHFPKEIIKEAIIKEEKIEKMSVNDIIDEIKQLISKL